MVLPSDRPREPPSTLVRAIKRAGAGEPALVAFAVIGAAGPLGLDPIEDLLRLLRAAGFGFLSRRGYVYDYGMASRLPWMRMGVATVSAGDRAHYRQTQSSPRPIEVVESASRSAVGSRRRFDRLGIA